MAFVSFLSWAAVVILPLGYWKQVWHIHKHKEVRDLSLSSYIFFATAYLFLGIESYYINSLLFLIKNLLVMIPTLVLIYQIIVHRDDKWDDCEYERMAERASCPKHQQIHRRINLKSKALD